MLRAATIPMLSLSARFAARKWRPSDHSSSTWPTFTAWARRGHSRVTCVATSPVTNTTLTGTWRLFTSKAAVTVGLTVVKNIFCFNPHSVCPHHYPGFPACIMFLDAGILFVQSVFCLSTPVFRSSSRYSVCSARILFAWDRGLCFTEQFCFLLLFPTESYIKSTLCLTRLRFLHAILSLGQFADVNLWQAGQRRLS